MKQNSVIVFFSFIVSLPALGAAVFNPETGVMVVDGTNTVLIGWENQDLSSSDKSFFLEDFAKVFAPCASNVVIGNAYADFLRETATPIPIGWSYDMWAFPTLDGIALPEIPILGKTPSKPDFSLEGTNYVLTLNNSLLGRIPNMRFIANTYSNEIAAAWSFALSIQTNVVNMSDSEVGMLRLSKAYEPGQCPSDIVQQIRLDLSGTPFPPALLGFGVLNQGPEEGVSYLWCQMPVQKNGAIVFVPMIYYNSRWWISYWFLEDIEKGW